MKEVNKNQLPTFFLNDWLPSIVLLVLIALYNKEQRKEKVPFFGGASSRINENPYVDLRSRGNPVIS